MYVSFIHFYLLGCGVGAGVGATVGDGEGTGDGTCRVAHGTRIIVATSMNVALARKGFAARN
jgi:hypothetical protein